MAGETNKIQSPIPKEKKTKMPTNPVDHLDPEDFYRLETEEEVSQFLESYQIGGFDKYRESVYGDYDIDNYGWDDYSY